MVIPSAKLYQTFLGRLKTQERAYNDLGLFYTPRLYSKFARRYPELKPVLTSIYESLLSRVGVVLCDGKEIKLHELSTISIKDRMVHATLNDGQSIMMKDFQIVDAAIKHITLDHKTSFFKLVEVNLANLTHLQALTQAICKGQCLNKEKMRSQYTRVVAEYPLEKVNGVLKDVQFIAEQTKLVLMPSHLNYAKGKK